MKHLIIGGHDGTSYAMCGAEGTGPDFEDRQPEDGDCPGCLGVWEECKPPEMDPLTAHWKASAEAIIAVWSKCRISGGRYVADGAQFVVADIRMPFGIARVESRMGGLWSLEIKRRGKPPYATIGGKTLDELIAILRKTPDKYTDKVLAAMG